MDVKSKQWAISMQRAIVRALAGAVVLRCAGSLLAQADAAAGPAVGQAAPVEVPAPPRQDSWPSDFLKSLSFSGFLEMSYTYNFQRPNPPAGPENVGRIFDVNHNEFMFNALELNIERPVNDEHVLGFKVTPFVGQDASATQAIGLFKGEDGVSDTDFDLINAYIQGYVPKTRTTIKLGKLETTVGAEVIHGPSNDNFSRSFLFGYTNPATHTGIMVTQPLFRRSSGDKDLLTAHFGVSNGWDNVKDLNDAKMLHFVAAFTPCDPFELTGNCFHSFSEQPNNNENARDLVDLVAKLTPADLVPDFKLLLNFNWGGEEGAAIGGGYAQWYGFAGIVRQDFALTSGEKNWFVAVRGEYFNDADGARTGGFGLAEDVALYELTFTLGFKPLESLLLRAEVRYDKADKGVFYHGSGEAGSPDENHQTTLAFEAAFLF
jgi:hypothetical protein